MKINETVSVIIPNYNGQELLQKHLPAVLACMRKGDELIIIDDASTDGSVPYLVQRFSLKAKKSESLEKYQGMYALSKKSLSITLLIQKTNQQFAHNCNVAVKMAQNPLLFLVNSDVSPKKNCLDELIKKYQERPKQTFAIGCLEYEAHNQRQKAGKNLLWFERGLFVHSRAQEFSSGTTAWASGGSALFDAAKWRNLGGFNEIYKPAYWEDIDLSYRARQKGWLVLFDSAAVVEHQHESTNATAYGPKAIATMSLRNALIFTRLHATLLQQLQHYLWLPYHLIKLGPTFLFALIAAQKRLSRVQY